MIDINRSYDELYMSQAISLAKKGWGRTGANPLVGAVVVNRGRIVGQGFHRKIGEAHAETAALLEAGSKARGATLYVNLEPCCTCGRTPPCVDMIIKTGIRRVVIGMLDPNPLVNGSGVGCLKNEGIDVLLPILEKESAKLNKWYVKYISRKVPYVSVKIAMSQDGKISGFSRKYITSERSRQFVHSLRSQANAVVIGINTILRDNPLLTDRLVGRANPARVVLDPRLRIPFDANFLIPDARRIVFTAANCDAAKKQKLTDLGVEFVEMPAEYFFLDTVLRKLGELEIGSILVEGGAIVFTQLLGKKLFDELYVFVAPIKGGEGIDMFNEINQAVNLSALEAISVGEDMLYHVYRNN